MEYQVGGHEAGKRFLHSVDNLFYLCENTKLSAMKKLLVIILVLLGLACTAVISCPDKQAHKDAIMAVLNESINDSLDPDGTDTTGLSQFFGSIGSGIAGFVLDSKLTVENYFVCSIGKIAPANGEAKTVSVGVFGHIFTFGKEDIKKAIRGE